MLHQGKEFVKSKRGKDPRYNGTNLAATGNPMKDADPDQVNQKRDPHPVRGLSLEVQTSKKGRLDSDPRDLDPEATGKGGVIYTIA